MVALLIILYCKWFHRLTSPRADKYGLYVRCLEDGRRLPFSWADGDEFRINGHRIGHHRLLDGKLEEVTSQERLGVDRIAENDICNRLDTER